MMNTTMLLIRHGQTDWNATRRSQGHIDIPLNGDGRRQSELLARRLASWPVGALYSSDLRRAGETAEIVGQALGLSPMFESALRERHGGVFQGHTTEELQELHPEALQAFVERGRNPPGGESNLDLARRATPALERIAAAHRGQTVALVTHGGTLRVMIAYILGLPVGRKAPFKVSGNTGLTIAEMSERHCYLKLLNDCCHLDEIEPGPAGQSVDEKSGDGGYAIG
jgi:broad specificity phosphatase PhoE